jgi:hypothetical protein
MYSFVPRRAGKTEKEAQKSLATAYVFFVD